MTDDHQTATDGDAVALDADAFTLDWTQVADVLRDEATPDLVDGDGTGLFLVAAAGDRPLLFAVGRPFPQGEHHAVVIELASLALGFGADRIAVGVTGRAWSMDDPIPPVTGGVDLRQRVLAVSAADGHRRDVPEVRGAVIPFAFDDHEVTWGETMPADDGEGWIPAALAVVVTQTEAFVDRPADLADQFHRCEALGHTLDLTPTAIAQLLAAAPAG